MKNLKLDKVINVYKPAGKTPLDCVKQLKNKYPNLQDKKIGYAGRLDPMAEGVLILLVEPETKNRSKYQSLDKEYEFEILFGASTDTSDILGTVYIKKRLNYSRIKVNQLLKLIPAIKDKKEQRYPAFSSKPYKGKPLYWWARNNKLHEISKWPEKEIAIKSLEFLDIKEITSKNIKKSVLKKIDRVKGDFRQKIIRRSWIEFFDSYNKNKMQIVKFKMICSSGTYIRSIANEIGMKLGCNAIAYSIKRITVGKFKIEESIRFN